MTPLNKLPRCGVEAAVGILPAAVQLLQVRERRRRRKSKRRVGRGCHDRGLRSRAQEHRGLQIEGVKDTWKCHIMINKNKVCHAWFWDCICLLAIINVDMIHSFIPEKTSDLYDFGKRISQLIWFSILLVICTPRGSQLKLTTSSSFTVLVFGNTFELWLMMAKISAWQKSILPTDKFARYRHTRLEWHHLQRHCAYSDSFDKSHVTIKCYCKHISAHSDTFHLCLGCHCNRGCL